MAAMMPVLPPQRSAYACRLMLLDAHPVLRLGVEVLLRQHAGVEVLGNYGRASQLLQALPQHADEVDMLVIDALPIGDCGDGMDLLRELSRRWPALPVLVLSAHCNASTVSTALQIGARGFLSKSATPEMLLRAVQIVARGGRFVPLDLRAELNRPHHARPAAAPTARLSRREREVVALVLQGCSTGEVASRFGRTASTISTQKKAAYRKLGIRSDGELFRIRHLLDCG